MAKIFPRAALRLSRAVKFLLLVPIVLALLSACRDELPPAKAVRATFDGNAGEILDDGRLIFHVFESVKDDPPERLPVFIGEDYGVMILNSGWEDNPRLLVKLGCPAGGWVKELGTLEEVKEAVAKLPEGSSVGYYDTCMCPRSWGLPAELLQEIRASIESRLRVVEMEEGHIICLCPND